ncbi:MAG: TIR domain-containing protein [Acidobacteriota bacterium]
MTTSSTQPPRVFISYAHGPTQHMERVKDLAKRLRDRGVDAEIDQYYISPVVRWPEWCARMIRRADFTLLLFDSTYSRRFEGDDVDGQEVVREGRGVRWEAALIKQILYDSPSQNLKLIPTVFDRADIGLIPAEIRGFTTFDLSQGEEFDRLLLHLYGRQAVEKPPLGNPPEFSLRSQSVPEATESQKPAPLHNLPAEEPLVGRGGDIERVEKALGGHRLVTLAAFAGLGKTSLALEVARRQIGAFADGVWLVSLAPVVEAALVPQAVAKTLSIREQAEKPPTRALAEQLRKKRLLIVLDNCEHLISACAELLRYLLDECPDVKFLATSREPLNLGKREVMLGLAPLEVPRHSGLPPQELIRVPAVQLFVDRVQRSDEAFRLNPSNASAVARICRRLEGIPLALELAAARVSPLAVERVADRLDDPSFLRQSPQAAENPHHVTLDATLDWSHDLLAPAAKRLFRRIAAFRGSFSFEAAEAICGDHPPTGEGLDDILEPFEDLVLKSLLEKDGNERFHFLEIVRQYAERRLRDADEEPLVQARHATYFLDIAEAANQEMLATGQKERLQLLDQEHPNLRAALRAAGDRETAYRLGIAMWRFWEMRGFFHEGRGRLTRLVPEETRTDPEALQADDRVEDELHSSVLSGLGLLAYRQGDVVEASRCFRRVLGFERRLGKPDRLANALGDVGLLSMHRDPDKAMGYFREGLHLAEEAKDDRLLAVAYNNLGKTELYRKRFPEARTLLRDSVAGFEAAGNLWESGFPLIGLGNLALEENQAEEAKVYFEKARERRLLVGDRRNVANSLLGIARAHLMTRDLVASRDTLRESIRLYDEVDDQASILRCWEIAAEIAALAGDGPAAARLSAFAERRREAMEISQRPTDKDTMETRLKGARDQIGDRAWSAARNEVVDWQRRNAVEAVRAITIADGAAGQ